MTTSIRILLPLLVILYSSLWSQPRTVQGTVRDAESGEPLPFVNIRVQNTTRGTTTDRRGSFILHLQPGDHRLVFSYLGYGTEVRSVTGGETLDVVLASRPIPFPEITVSPNEDAAVAVIRKAIEAKKRRKDSLRDYSLTAHTKLVIDMDKMEGIAVNTISDSSFKGVMETRTDAYWARPDRYKEIIKARKQTSFITSRSNTLISKFFIMDFSADRFDIGKEIIGPISDEGLDAYYYQLLDTTSLDDVAVFRIHVFPRSEDDPLVTGDLYIVDKSFALVRVDLRPDEAAMPDFFDSLRFRQQFARFGNFWMPVDVAIDANISLSFIIQLKLRLEAYSVLQDYHINEGFAEDFFDRVVIKVLPEADERDSLYWVREALIPNTPEELEAYEKGDSVKASMQEKRNEVTWSSPLFGQTFQSGDEYIRVPGILGLYGFNRVQGHFLSGRFGYVNRRSWLRSLSIEPGYGIDDRRASLEGTASMRFGRASPFQVDLSGFRRLSWIDREREHWSAFNTTLTNLVARWDFRDYFYETGWRAAVSGDVLPVVRASVGWEQRQYENANVNADWSLFSRDRSFRDNPAVNPGRLHRIVIDLTLDTRDYIDNAGEIRRLGGAPTQHFFNAGIRIADRSLLGGDFTFTQIVSGIRGGISFGAWGVTTYRMSSVYSTGAVPTQAVWNLQAVPNYTSTRFRFRALDFREFSGDRAAEVFVEHDFDDVIWRKLGIPFLRSSGLGLIVFGNAGWTDMTRSSHDLQTVPVRVARLPYLEAGFGIDNIFLMFRLDVAWRLNHFRDGRNFFIGVSAPFVEM